MTIRTLLLRFFETGLKSSNNEQLFVTSLRTSADGQTPHRGAAIGLVFERLIEDGRKALFTSGKSKPPSTHETVTITTTNTPTKRTKSPLDIGSSNGSGGNSETTKLSSAKESKKSKKKLGGKRSKVEKHSHSPPCGCKICERAERASEES